MFPTFQRVVAMTLASSMSFALLAPSLVTDAFAAPLPVSTILATTQSADSVGMSLTDVRYRRYGRRGNGAAVALGVLGLGLGVAAVAASQRRRDRYYDDGYYNQDYGNQGYYAPAYGSYSYRSGYGDSYGYRDQRYSRGGYGGQRYYPQDTTTGQGPRAFGGGGNK